MRRALILTTTAAAAAVLAVPAAAGDKTAVQAHYGAEHVARNQGDPLTPEGQHTWTVRVQQVGSAFYASAEHVKTYVDAAGNGFQLEEWTGTRGLGHRLPSGAVTVSPNGDELVLVDVVLPTTAATSTTTGPFSTGRTPGHTTLSGTWRRNGSENKAQFTFGSADVDGSGTSGSTECERLTSEPLSLHSARTSIRVFGQLVPEAAAKTGGATGLASYALPGSEAC